MYDEVRQLDLRWFYGEESTADLVISDIIISSHTFQLDLRHMNQLPSNNSIGVAMDLRDFYISTEWDVMEVPAQRNEKYYPCCEVKEIV